MYNTPYHIWNKIFCFKRYILSPINIKTLKKYLNPYLPIQITDKVLNIFFEKSDDIIQTFKLKDLKKSESMPDYYEINKDYWINKTNYSLFIKLINKNTLLEIDNKWKIYWPWFVAMWYKLY